MPMLEIGITPIGPILVAPYRSPYVVESRWQFSLGAHASNLIAIKGHLLYHVCTYIHDTG